MFDHSNVSGCPCDEDKNLSVCYAETSMEDRNTSTENHVLTVAVWSHLGPPTKYHTLHVPAVSARKVEIMQVLLSGKTQPATPPVYHAKSYCEAASLSRASTKVHYET